ncbi:hypothetical protein G7074_01645 [Pedobacter sp. HDW13]|uniref:hypothetical protein n=1 Tax=Pedobacter sp. HDW13 TaxID=2714940 RepID=UPI0014096E03|nr:hypothetical protein [Pedobacter sp. HDW13]QIL38093.1 hypothetical protein G7074_01645 [Pedobacter sp. HDW13]
MATINITVLLSVIAGLASFCWTVIQYLDTRKREQNLKEFEQFHKLLKELVQPEDEMGTMYVDRQTAIIFELRHFKRYYPYSLRTLKGLLEKWKQVPNQFPRILEETQLTVEYLESKVKL